MIPFDYPLGKIKSENVSMKSGKRKAKRKKENSNKRVREQRKSERRKITEGN